MKPFDNEPTAAPWAFQERSDGYVYVVDAEQIVIARCGQAQMPHKMANARLMAAAPELLEVLKGLLYGKPYKAVAMALIAKAERK